ncbi:MAG TPA: UDP-N-acetylmuramate--L-alanine ligase [Dermatophilaceae bacterium]|nr:UDP-N-acetylmuramate--L-alanine ligase [Dermatophilaceae bacterium]
MDGVDDRFDFTAPVPGPDALGHVHVLAAGGAGMSAVVRILLGRGVPVSGCDTADSATLEALGAAGARVRVGHDVAHLEGVDTVVVSSAVREGTPELAAARAGGRRVLHRAQALASATTGARVVAVAGANGKTTTASMLTVALRAAGLDPSFALGGELPVSGEWTNAAWTGSGTVVVEADESDGSFLVYRPEVAVVTNVQPDHLDFYGTYERLREAYAAFAASVRPGGLLLAGADDAGSRALAEAARAAGRRVLTYGRDPRAALRVRGTRAAGMGSTSTLVGPDGVPRVLRLGVPGAHNVEDACAAYLAATAGLGADPEAVLEGLDGFSGARRRFEVRGEVGGVTVVDDYAHNVGKVTAVVGTASAMARARGGSLHVVFQPHLFTRTRDFADGFAAALAPADDVVLLEVYGAREDPIEGVGSHLVAAHLTRLGGDRAVAVEPGFEAAARAVARRCRPGDLVLTVGAGTVTTLAPLLLRALQEERR